MSASPPSYPADLPQGWERSTDKWGREFYIDHNTGRTQWERPQSTETVDKPTAPPAYQDVSQAPPYQAGSFAVDPSLAGSTASSGSAPPQLQQYPQPGYLPGQPLQLNIAPVAPVAPGGPIILQVAGAGMLAVGDTAYTAGQSDPSLAPGAPTAQPQSTRDTLAPGYSAVNDALEPFAFERLGFLSACARGLETYPIACALTLVTLLLFAGFAVLLAVMLNTETDYWGDHDLSYLPGIIICGMFGFMTYIVNCSVHLAAVPCCDGCCFYNGTKPSLSRNRARAAPQANAHNATSLFGGAGGGPFNGGFAINNGRGQQANRTPCMPKYRDWFNAHMSEAGTYRDLEDYLDETRTARMTLSARVRCFASEQGPMMSWARINVTYIAETPLTIASARDTTISSEDLRTWLREQARGDTFLATLDHTFDATPQSRDVLNAVCTHYQGVMASVATSSSAWIEFEPLVAPVKGTFIVSENSGGSFYVSCMRSCWCPTFAVMFCCVPCYAGLWHWVPRVRVGSRKLINVAPPILESDPSRLRIIGRMQVA